MKTRIACLTILVLFSSLAIFGQDQMAESLFKSQETKVNLKRTIRLENDSDIEDVVVTIDKKTERFELMISSSLTHGILSMELYDPENSKLENFTIGTALNSQKKETVNGNIRKSFYDPLLGDWRIKIIPKNATANISIQTALSANDYYLHVPETFSPKGNNDGDILKIEAKNISDTISFTIFDKFGSVVYESHNIDEGWNGTTNGELQPTGTYLYVIRAKNLFGYEVLKNGIIKLSND
ncbi:MAG: gliding motility-associated C-terminal domain-containing protein [Bacteroidales bacterium]|nr:gliding motility-associated C-terminal domain-containing protein [Bacteroidales bacterium]